MSTTIAHDPFARGAYRRFTRANTARHHTCCGCGQAPRRLYSYAWEYDDCPRQQTDPGRYFCTLECYKYCYL
jgi:hypothetical protein